MFDFYKSHKQIKGDEQQIIVEMLANGSRAKDIAAFFCLSERTIESKIQKIMKRHNAKSQCNLIAIFFRTGEIK